MTGTASPAGGDSGAAEPGRQGPLPLRERGLERQWGGQTPPPRTAGASSERPHLPDHRRHLTWAQQRDGPCKPQQTHQTCCDVQYWESFNKMFIHLLRFSLFSGWMPLLTTFFKYTMVFSTRTGKTSAVKFIFTILQLSLYLFTLLELHLLILLSLLIIVWLWHF